MALKEIFLMEDYFAISIQKTSRPLSNREVLSVTLDIIFSSKHHELHFTDYLSARKINASSLLMA
jgi:hypothetical protein